jgi:hypothetical protein
VCTRKTSPSKTRRNIHISRRFVRKVKAGLRQCHFLFHDGSHTIRPRTARAGIVANENLPYHGPWYRVCVSISIPVGRSEADTPSCREVVASQMTNSLLGYTVSQSPKDVNNNSNNSKQLCRWRAKFCRWRFVCFYLNRSETQEGDTGSRSAVSAEPQRSPKTGH